jgi:hypothetical protein
LIIDRFDIIDVYNRYAIGVDTRNEEVCRSCFTDDLLVDLPGESVEYTADAHAYLQALHFNKDNTFSVWGHYSHKLTGTPEDWRINKLTLTTDWHEFK